MSSSKDSRVDRTIDTVPLSRREGFFYKKKNIGVWASNREEAKLLIGTPCTAIVTLPLFRSSTEFQRGNP